MEKSKKTAMSYINIRQETYSLFMLMSTSSCFYSCGIDKYTPDIVYFSEKNYYGLKLNVLKGKTERLLEFANWIITHASRKNFNLKTYIIFDIYWLLKIANTYLDKIVNFERISDDLIMIISKNQDFDSCYFLNKKYRVVERFIEVNIFKRNYLNSDFKLLKPYYDERQDRMIYRDRQLNEIDVFFNKMDKRITVDKLPIMIVCRTCRLNFIGQDWSYFSDKISALKKIILKAPSIINLPDEVFLKLVALKLILDECCLQDGKNDQDLLKFYVAEIKKREISII